MELKKPALRERAIRLIAPLGFLVSEWRTEDYEHLRKYKTFEEGKVIASKYGTDMDHSGMEDLRDLFLNYEADARTFDEVALDLGTRAEWEMYELTEIEKAVLRTVSYKDYSIFVERYPRSTSTLFVDDRRPNRITDGLVGLGILRDMKVDDWVTELKSILDWKHFHQVETWT